MGKMINLSQINSLLTQWEERKNSSVCLTAYQRAYNDGLRDCIYDLQCLTKDVLETEILDSMPSEEIQKMIDEQEADNYLASIEAHEN